MPGVAGTAGTALIILAYIASPLSSVVAGYMLFRIIEEFFGGERSEIARYFFAVLACFIFTLGVVMSVISTPVAVGVNETRTTTAIGIQREIYWGITVSLSSENTTINSTTIYQPLNRLVASLTGVDPASIATYALYANATILIVSAVILLVSAVYKP